MPWRAAARRGKNTKPHGAEGNKCGDDLTRRKRSERVWVGGRLGNLGRNKLGRSRFGETIFGRSRFGGIMFGRSSFG